MGHLLNIKSVFNNYKFYDLEPENDEITKIPDYLKYDYNTINKEPNSQVPLIH